MLAYGQAKDAVGAREGEAVDGCVVRGPVDLADGEFLEDSWIEDFFGFY